MRVSRQQITYIPIAVLLDSLNAVSAFVKHRINESKK